MVMVPQASQFRITTDLFRPCWIFGIVKRDGNDISDALVRTPRVVMDLGQFEDMREMPFTQEDKVVERLTNLPDVPFGKGVTKRRTWRRFHDPDSITTGHRIKGPESGIPVVNEQTAWEIFFVTKDGEVACLLRDPGVIWLWRTTGDQNPASTQVNEK